MGWIIFERKKIVISIIKCNLLIYNILKWSDMVILILIYTKIGVFFKHMRIYIDLYRRFV